MIGKTMARPHLPKNIHILKGTAKQHPERMRERENEPVNTQPIGKPSKHLSKLEKEFFKEIVGLAIDGVLGEADRPAVEFTANLFLKARGLYVVEGEIIPATSGEQQLLFKYLGQFGMLPAERAKLSIEPAKKKSAFDD
jgi:hypothetical protein